MSEERECDAPMFDLSLCMCTSARIMLARILTGASRSLASPIVTTTVVRSLSEAASGPVLTGKVKGFDQKKGGKTFLLSRRIVMLDCVVIGSGMSTL